MYSIINILLFNKLLLIVKKFFLSKVIVPCGHKLCENCAKRLTTVSNKCPWDRQVIESIEFIKND